MNCRLGERKQIPACRRSLRSRLLRLWSAYWRYKAQRAAVVVLPMLDDRILADIGLTRSDVRAIVLSSKADRVHLQEAGGDVPRTDTTKPQAAATGTRMDGLTLP
jgi:uncharacterized protein YjiS (DUF1127 family)